MAGTQVLCGRGMAFTPQELQAGFRIGDCLIEPRQNRIVRRDIEVRAPDHAEDDPVDDEREDAATHCGYDVPPGRA